MRDELGTDARAFLDEANGGHDPSHADRVRIAEALAASLGPAALGGAASSLFPKGAVVSKGLFASLGAKIALTVVVGTTALGTAAFVALSPSPSSDSARATSSRSSAQAVESARPQSQPSERALATAPIVAQPAYAAQPTYAAQPATVHQEATARTGIAEDVPTAAEVADVRAESPRARTVATARTSPSSPRSISEPTAPRASSLSRELELLQGARSALRENDAPRALSLLDEHRRAFASSSMDVEARMLRVDAFCSLGRLDDARSEAHALVSPSASPAVVSRVRRSCVGGDFGTEGSSSEH